MRLRLVHEMNCEVRRDSEAALREADVSFGKVQASKPRGAAALAETSESMPSPGNQPDESTSRAMEQRFVRALEEISRRWERDDGSPGIKLDLGPLLHATGAGARPGTRRSRATCRSRAPREAYAVHLGAGPRDLTGLDRWEAISKRGQEALVGSMPELEWLSLLPQAADLPPIFPQAAAYPLPGLGDAERVWHPGADEHTGCDPDESESANDGMWLNPPEVGALHVDPARLSPPNVQPHDTPELASQRPLHPAQSKRSPAVSEDDDAQPTVLRRSKIRSRRRVVDCSSSDDDFEAAPHPAASRLAPPPCPAEDVAGTDDHAGMPEECRHGSPAEPPERGPVQDAPLLVPIREQMPFSAGEAPPGGGTAGFGSRRSFRRKTIEANLEPLPDERPPSRRDESAEGLVLDLKLGWKFVLPPEAIDTKRGAGMFEPVRCVPGPKAPAPHTRASRQPPTASSTPNSPVCGSPVHARPALGHACAMSLPCFPAQMLSKGALWRLARDTSTARGDAGEHAEAWKSSVPERCCADDADCDDSPVALDDGQGVEEPEDVPASRPLPGGAEQAVHWPPHVGRDGLDSDPNAHLAGPAEGGRANSHRPLATTIQGRLERRTPMPSVPQLGQRIATHFSTSRGNGADVQLSALARDETVSGGSTPARVFLGLLWAATTQHTLACQHRNGSSAVAESPFPSGASVHLSVSDRDAEGRSIDVRVAMQQ